MIVVHRPARRAVWWGMVVLVCSVSVWMAWRWPGDVGTPPVRVWTGSASWPDARAVPEAADTHGDDAASASPWWSADAPPAKDVRLGVTQPFRVDAHGQLSVDATTLKTLEQVQAFSVSGHVEDSARAAARGLPESALRQALDLAARYERYDASLHQIVSADHAPASVAEMAAQFESMQQARRAQFGEAVARQLFGDQEAITARLIALMQADPQADASLEDKATRAQARWLAEQGATSPPPGQDPR